MDEIDLYITKKIYNFFNNKWSSNITEIFGVIPFEIYEKVGMYSSILQVLWMSTPNPFQFHLVPYWFTFTIIRILKEIIPRKRPGCFHKDMDTFIDKTICKNEKKYQSFPSMHSGTSFALAVALMMEMKYSKNPYFFEFKIKQTTSKNTISIIGLCVAFIVCIHRISKGYHSFFDVLTGALIGASVGFISWTSLEFYKKMYQELCDKDKNKKEPLCKNYNISKSNNWSLKVWLSKYNLFKSKETKDKVLSFITGIIRIILTIPILYLLIIFLTKDLFKLLSFRALHY